MHQCKPQLFQNSFMLFEPDKLLPKKTKKCVRENNDVMSKKRQCRMWQMYF